jgi:hypothetical protein
MKTENPKTIEYSKISESLYTVDVVIWEGGTGRTMMQVLCNNLKDALVVQQALKNTVPSHINSECGDEKVYRKIVVDISPEHKSSVQDFVTEGW